MTATAAPRRRRMRRRPPGEASPYRTEPLAQPYEDPLPALGLKLPPEMLRDLMTAPPVMTAEQAAPYLGLSESRVRLLIRRGELAGCSGSKQGSARAVVSRTAVIQYWERRYS